MAKTIKQRTAQQLSKHEDKKKALAIKARRKAKRLAIA